MKHSKLCHTCNTVWNINDFDRNRCSPDGRQSMCFKCKQEWGAAYRKPSLRGRRGPYTVNWKSKRYTQKTKRMRGLRRRRSA